MVVVAFTISINIKWGKREAKWVEGKFFEADGHSEDWSRDA